MRIRALQGTGSDSGESRRRAGLQNLGAALDSWTNYLFPSIRAMTLLLPRGLPRVNKMHCLQSILSSYVD